MVAWAYCSDQWIVKFQSCLIAFWLSLLWELGSSLKHHHNLFVIGWTMAIRKWLLLFSIWLWELFSSLMEWGLYDHWLLPHCRDYWRMMRISVFLTVMYQNPSLFCSEHLVFSFCFGFYERMHVCCMFDNIPGSSAGVSLLPNFLFLPHPPWPPLSLNHLLPSSVRFW